MSAGAWLQRLRSSSGVSAEGQGQHLGIRGRLVGAICGKHESRSCLLSSLSHDSGLRVKQTLAAESAGCFVGVARWMRPHPPWGLDSHMPFSLPPILPPSPSPHLSVQLQPTLISTVSLQREPLKGQGEWLPPQQSHQLEIYQNPRKEWKRQVQAGLLIIGWCKRWGT